MKKIALVIIVSAALYIVACSLEDSWPIATTDPHEEKCSYTMKKHADEMYFDMQVRCPYDSLCSSRLVFGSALGERINDCLPDNYEYQFVDELLNKNIKMNSNVDLLIHSDNHVYFSLFDSARVEKKYDIDLSSIIHSYTKQGDSIRIVMPEYLWAIELDSAGSWHRTLRKDCENNQVTFYVGEGVERKYSFFVFDGAFGLNTEYGRDSIRISGSIYWK